MLPTADISFWDLLLIKLPNIFVFLILGSFIMIGILWSFNKFEDVIFNKINWQDEIKKGNLAAAIVFSTIIWSTVYMIIKMIN